MKWTYLHKMLSVTLSLLVLFSTLSFTVEKHYCGEHLVDTAIFSESKKCVSMDAKEASYVKKPCCKDTVEVFEGQDKLSTIDFEYLEKIQKQVLIACSFLYVNDFEDLSSKVNLYNYYIPPNIRKDIHVLYEVYLI